MNILVLNAGSASLKPFDLFVQNRASRYHIVVQAVQVVAETNSRLRRSAASIVSSYEDKLARHHAFIREHGEDMPEISEWQWRPIA